jgi:hypothetical protein
MARQSGHDSDPTVHHAPSSLGEPAISGEQCAAARAWLRLEITQLAAELGTTRGTLRRFEACENVPRKATLAALRAFFEERGIVFVWSPDGYPEGILASMPAWRLDYHRMRELKAQHSRGAVLRRAKQRPHPNQLANQLAMMPNVMRPNLAELVVPPSEKIGAPPADVPAPAPPERLARGAPERAPPVDRQRHGERHGERLAALEAEERRIMAEIAAAKRAAPQEAKWGDDDEEF